MKAGDYLRAARKREGLTLEEIAQAVGVTKTTVSKWERGAIRSMGVDKVIGLAQALNIEPMDLLRYFTQTLLKEEHNG